MERLVNSEIPAAKMKGYAAGDKKYWEFIPPGLDEGDPNSGDPEYDWWGDIFPSAFRFKKGGSEEYVLFDGTNIVTGTTNDVTKSFVTSAGGTIVIKLFWDGTKFDKVSLEASDKLLEYTNGQISINGIPASTARTFGGASLPLKSGTQYIFEGVVDLVNDQNITATGVNLAIPKADPDVFTGQGNTTWKMAGISGAWLVTIDPFANTVQVVNNDGYPSAIYMDGWGFAKFDGDNSKEWWQDYMLTLQRVGETSVYEATFHNYGWGTDVKFHAAPKTDPQWGGKILEFQYFSNGEEGPDGKGFKVVPAGAGRVKVSVDLKQGFEYEEEDDELVLILNGDEFTVSFTMI